MQDGERGFGFVLNASRREANGRRARALLTGADVLVDGPELIDVVAGDGEFAAEFDRGLHGAALVLRAIGGAGLFAVEVPGGFGLVEAERGPGGFGAGAEQGAEGADQFRLVAVGGVELVLGADVDVDGGLRPGAEGLLRSGLLGLHEGEGAGV